jgi:two-component system, cell cycle sensor histidine kinase and response regulator CckA
VHLGVRPGSHVMLAVSDTGIGMDDALQARIFEPFFTTKDPGRGTGLGLATVLGIIEQSGGTICTDSKPGQGTTLRVYLPRLAPSETTAVESEEPTPTGAKALHGSETILLVEDDHDVRSLMRTILERQGYDVLDASNGREALLICETLARSVHLLVTDVVMPRMGGRDLSERMLMLWPAVKILYVSGYTAGAIGTTGVLGPGTAFLQKPIESDVLVRAVREVLDSTAGQRIPSAVAWPKVSN